MVMKWWMLFFPWQNFLDRVLEFRTHAVATAVCTTVCEHTLTCCTQFSVVHTLLVYFAHSWCVSHTRMAQGCQKASLHMCHTSPCRLLQSPHSFFTHLCCSLTSTSASLSPHVLTVLTCPESAGHAQLRTCIAKFGYRVKSDANTGYEPKKFDKITSVDDDTMLINDPNDNFSDFTKTTNENTRHFGVPSVWILCFARFSWWSCSSNRSQRSRQSGNRCQTEREKGKRRFCDQCSIVDVKEKSTQQY